MKIVGKCFYVHISNLEELVSKLEEQEQKRLYEYMELLEKENFLFLVVKYNKENNSFSFIESDDWDIANEPSVGNSWCFKEDGTRKLVKSSNKIYHSKHLFVASDYKGFDVEKAKERTRLWNTIPNLNKNKIGNKTYWQQLLKEHNIEI